MDITIGGAFTAPSQPRKIQMASRKYPNTPEGQAARKQVRATYQLAYRSANREKQSHKERYRRFGITEHEYNEMIAKQGNRCAICQEMETATRLGKVRALSVDHNHQTGMVRGLLCSDCNTGIGKLKENRKTLLSAVKYLDHHSDCEDVVINLSEERNG